MQDQNNSGLIFSRQLRAEMESRGITQVVMAEKVGVTQGAVSGWLRGAVPKMDKLSKIAEVLGLSPDRLLNPEKYAEPLEAAKRAADGVPDELKPKVFNDVARVLTKQLPGAHSDGARGALKAARLAKGMTQKQLAAAVGYSLGVYQNIEEGMSGISRKQAEKLAKVLGIDVVTLLDGSDHPTENTVPFGTFGETPNINLPPGMRAKYVPLISWVQCGTMAAFDDTAYVKDGFLAINPTDPKAFAVTLAGESMAPVYTPGDVAIVYPSREPRNGSVVIAKLNEDHGSDVMLKLYQKHGKDEVKLYSYNEQFPPLTFPRSAFAWIYSVGQVTKTLH